MAYNIKKNILLSTILSIGLFGCGSSDNNGQTNTNSSGNGAGFQQWASYYFEDDLSSELEVLTIDQAGQYYLKSVRGTPFNYMTVTQDGLYDVGPTHTEYGVLHGKIQISGNTWHHAPYSSIGSSGLSHTITFKTVDLSQKNMSAVLFSDAYWISKHNLTHLESAVSPTTLNFVKSSGGMQTFPAGSSCLVMQTSKYSQDHLELYQDGYYNAAELEEEFGILAQDLTATKYNFKDTTAYVAEDESYGFAHYKNNYYNADFYSKNQTNVMQDYLESVDEVIQELKQRPTLTDAQLSELKSLLSTDCSFYNATATQAIEAHVGR